MKNQSLVLDYFKRAKSRLRALDVLFEDQSWADVVRESQELCELVLKAVLRSSNIDPPRIHDVSAVLEANESVLPPVFKENLKKVIKISKSLRRDRELSFYGSDDLTPSEFYQKEDAEEAMAWARFLVELSDQVKV
jgi:HEPN domain-containing protein